MLLNRMRGIFFVIFVTAACCMVIDGTLLGGFSPVDSNDEAMVHTCQDKILSTMKMEEEQANSGYVVEVTILQPVVQKQVVNGINLHFDFTKHAKYEVPSGSNALPKAETDKKCTATVFVDRDNTKPLVYLPGKEPKCE